jgi:hypothetical protein
MSPISPSPQGQPSPEKQGPTTGGEQKKSKSPYDCKSANKKKQDKKKRKVL